ncbi:hypothetical protein ACIQPQ_12110 [Streptomyces sp. NPDC091281]|uniref:hypothetical protein n=1 Tax=Streptomyces sp. NPDC091281 TaxID=3365985 RepID=UPI00381C97CE
MRRTDSDRQRRQDLAEIPPGHHVRLLPWTTDGKRCLLSTDNAGGYLSRLADEMESIQLAMGSEVLEHAGKVLDDQTASTGELRYAGVRLAECLRDALRVAESRGMRLPVPEDVEDDENDSDSPAEAVG